MWRNLNDLKSRIIFGWGGFAFGDRYPVTISEYFNYNQYLCFGVMEATCLEMYFIVISSPIIWTATDVELGFLFSRLVLKYNI